MHVVPAGNVTGEPEPMGEKDQREAAIVIDTFGLPLVRLVSLLG